MSGSVFEIIYRDKLWRVSSSTYDGSPRLTFWAHYRHRETGDWKPCGGKRDAPGCIVPADRVEEFAEAVVAIAAELKADACRKAS